MASNYIALSNTACETNATGRITHKGLRYKAGSDSNQSVLNMRVMFRRSFRRTDASPWEEVKSYVDFALWGTRAESLKAQLEKFAPIETITDGHEVRVKVTFSLTDFKIGKPWGGADGKEPRQDLTFKAISAEIVSVTESNFGQTPVEGQPVPVIELEDVPL